MTPPTTEAVNCNEQPRKPHISVEQPTTVALRRKSDILGRVCTTRSIGGGNNTLVVYLVPNPNSKIAPLEKPIYTIGVGPRDAPGTSTDSVKEKKQGLSTKTHIFSLDVSWHC